MIGIVRRRSRGRCCWRARDASLEVRAVQSIADIADGAGIESAFAEIQADLGDPGVGRA